MEDIDNKDQKTNISQELENQNSFSRDQFNEEEQNFLNSFGEYETKQKQLQDQYKKSMKSEMNKQQVLGLKSRRNLKNEASPEYYLPSDRRNSNQRNQRKNLYKEDLLKQIQEKEDKKKKKESDQSYYYFPFGRPGAGAPLRDENGQIVAVRNSIENQFFQSLQYSPTQQKKISDHQLRQSMEQKKEQSQKLYQQELEQQIQEKLKKKQDLQQKQLMQDLKEEQRIKNQLKEMHEEFLKEMKQLQDFDKQKLNENSKQQNYIGLKHISKPKQQNNQTNSTLNDNESAQNQETDIILNQEKPLETQVYDQVNQETIEQQLMNIKQEIQRQNEILQEQLQQLQKAQQQEQQKLISQELEKMRSHYVQRTLDDDLRSIKLYSSLSKAPGRYDLIEPIEYINKADLKGNLDQMRLSHNQGKSYLQNQNPLIKSYSNANSYYPQHFKLQGDSLLYQSLDFQYPRESQNQLSVSKDLHENNSFKSTQNLTQNTQTFQQYRNYQLRQPQINNFQAPNLLQSQHIKSFSQFQKQMDAKEELNKLDQILFDLRV